MRMFVCDETAFSAVLSLVQVRPNADAAGGATVQLSAVEVRALFNILNFVAREGSIAKKPGRDMAALRLAHDSYLAMFTEALAGR
jgi:hypothetical protein